MAPADRLRPPLDPEPVRAFLDSMRCKATTVSGMHCAECCMGTGWEVDSQEELDLARSLVALLSAVGQRVTPLEPEALCRLRSTLDEVIDLRRYDFVPTEVAALLAERDGLAELVRRVHRALRIVGGVDAPLALLGNLQVTDPAAAALLRRTLDEAGSDDG